MNELIWNEGSISCLPTQMSLNSVELSWVREWELEFEDLESLEENGWKLVICNLGPLESDY